jgi:enoyl-CoA hydratase/carnithine racemase
LLPSPTFFTITAPLPSPVLRAGDEPDSKSPSITEAVAPAGAAGDAASDPKEPPMTASPSDPAVLFEEADDILIMRINRPRSRNSLNREALRRLAEGYTRLSQDDRLRCGVVCGEGEVFCAGLDLADVIPASIEAGSQVYLQPGQCDPFRLYGPPCAKPVVVAVHGRCYTAGLELTLAADLCVAAAGTRFGQQEATRGIMPMGGATFRLPAAIGWGPAMRCMLAGGEFSAEDAYARGLVQVLTEPGEHLSAALELARRVAACAPLAVQATLANARLAEQEGPAAAAEHVLREGRRVAQTQDAMEGMMSLMEKRAARFVGR